MDLLKINSKETILSTLGHDELYKTLRSLPDITKPDKSDKSKTTTLSIEQKELLDERLAQTKPTAKNLQSYLLMGRQINGFKNYSKGLEYNTKVATYMAIYPDILEEMELDFLMANLHDRGESFTPNLTCFDGKNIDKSQWICTDNKPRYSYSDDSNLENLRSIKFDMVLMKLQNLNYKVTARQFETFVSANMGGECK